MTESPGMEVVCEALSDGARLEMLELLRDEERPVGELVERLGLAQPSVSKHLRVLREAGLVTHRKDGRRRLYRARAEGLRGVHQWTSAFQRYWRVNLAGIKHRAEAASPGRDSVDQIGSDQDGSDRDNTSKNGDES